MLLLLTGWTDYAFSSDNIAAHQAGLALHPPSLQVRDNNGEWQTVIEEIGIPVGRPQTIVVDLADSCAVREPREVRIVDEHARLLGSDSGRHRAIAAVTPRLTSSRRLDRIAADLRWRGFSAEVDARGREPFTYDYARVSRHHPGS